MLAGLARGEPHLDPVTSRSDPEHDLLCSPQRRKGRGLCTENSRDFHIGPVGYATGMWEPLNPAAGSVQQGAPWTQPTWPGEAARLKSPRRLGEHCSRRWSGLGIYRFGPRTALVAGEPRVGFPRGRKRNRGTPKLEPPSLHRSRQRPERNISMFPMEGRVGVW